MKEPNLKQWKRRALKAEIELEMIRKIIADDIDRDMQRALENATLRVALREIQEASNWAYGEISGKLILASNVR